MAALIKSQGVLQNLIVVLPTTKRGKATGKYGVVAGGRRLRALQLLAKTGDLSSALNVRAKDCDAESTSETDDLSTSPAWAALKECLDGWRARMPVDEEALLPWLIAQPQQAVLDLLALCSALSVNAIVRQECDHPGDGLAAAVGFDMADWWTPTAGGYLDHVPKARIVEDVTDVTGAGQAAPLAKL